MIPSVSKSYLDRKTGEKMRTEKCDLIRNINLVDVGRSIGRIL